MPDIGSIGYWWYGVAFVLGIVVALLVERVIWPQLKKSIGKARE
jgi:prolipoprotein diacylglyceryltransferase